MRRPVVQIVFLTALFVGVYAALRSIPSTNCNFLHCEQTIVTADGLQFCGSGASHFVDLSRLPFPVTVHLSSDQPAAVGQSAHYTLSIETPDGNLLRPSDIAVTQTKLIHVLLVDPSLGDYQHIHPVPDGETGQWTFDFTPRRAGTYRLLAQCVPSYTLRELVGQAQIDVPGQPSPDVPRGLKPFADDGYVYSLHTTPDAVAAGSDATLTLSVRRANGGPVTLEPVMGTLGHMVAFDTGQRGFAHLHPTLTGHERDADDPALAFVLNLATPGRYRLWGQVRLDGRERFVPFDLQVM